MSRSTELSFRKMKEVLSAIDGMSKEQWDSFEKGNSCSLDEMRTYFQNQCYNIDFLTLTQQKALRKEIESMAEFQLKAVERVNELTIDEVKELLDLVISEYDTKAMAIREFKKAWKIREKEVERQLINEGIIQPLECGCCMTDVFTQSERMMHAQVELAKELGLHLRFGNPLTGYMES